jgi:hypothetical protein
MPRMKGWKMNVKTSESKLQDSMMKIYSCRHFYNSSGTKTMSKNKAFKKFSINSRLHKPNYHLTINSTTKSSKKTTKLQGLSKINVGSINRFLKGKMKSKSWMKTKGLWGCIMKILSESRCKVPKIKSLNRCPISLRLPSKRCKL